MGVQPLLRSPRSSLTSCRGLSIACSSPLFVTPNCGVVVQGWIEVARGRKLQAKILDQVETIHAGACCRRRGLELMERMRPSSRPPRFHRRRSPILIGAIALLVIVSGAMSVLLLTRSKNHSADDGDVARLVEAIRAAESRDVIDARNVATAPTGETNAAA